MRRRPVLRTAGLALLFLAAMAACRKEDPEPRHPPHAGASMVVRHEVDGEPLVRDTLRYFNAMGHSYGVTRLEYYLSGLVLKGSGGTPDHAVPGPWYVNAAADNTFDLGVLPVGAYAGLHIQLGLPPELNQTNALPATMANVNMAWPIPMGGGYHFMKFEGHFIHQGQPAGFAMHVGRDQNLVHGDMPRAFVVGEGQGRLVLHFNLNEVFRDPHTYNLSTGNQSMGSDSLMGLLRDNCADVFTFEFLP